MKTIRTAFFAVLCICNCKSVDKADLVRMAAQHHQSLNQNMITGLTLILGAFASQGWNYLDQCGNQCPASHCLPLIPGAFLLAHSLLSDYLRK